MRSNQIYQLSSETAKVNNILTITTALVTTVAKTEYSGISDEVKLHLQNLCQSTHYPHWWQWWSVVSCPGPITPPTALLMSEEEFSLSSHSSNEQWSVELATNLCKVTGSSISIVS